jgi:hypothetical protein
MNIKKELVIMFNNTVMCIVFLIVSHTYVDVSHAITIAIDDNDKNAGINNLLHYTMHYKGYEEDYEIYAQSYNKKQEAIGEQYTIIDLTVCAANQRTADLYAKGLLDTMHGHRSLDSLLNLVLKERLELLERRSNAKTKMFEVMSQLKNNPKKDVVMRCERVAYTHPSMIKKYYENDPVMQRQSRADTTFYQFVNSLIVGLYKLAEPKEVSEKTRFLIRASPCLHGLLKGETNDLGHPDEAIYVDESDSMGKEFDFYYYETYVLKSELVNVPLLGYSKGESIKIFMTQYDRSQTDESYYYLGIPDLPYPKWLERKVEIASTQSSSCLAETITTSSPAKLSMTPENMLESKNSQESKTTVEAMAASSSSKEMKHPQPVQNGAVRSDENCNTSNSIERADVPTHDSKPMRDLENLPLESKYQKEAIEQIIGEMRDLQIRKPSPVLQENETSQGRADTSQGKTETPEGSYNKAMHPSLVFSSISPVTSRTIEANVKKPVISLTTSSNDQPRLAPRGMRVFHPHTNQTFVTQLTSLDQLKGKHSETHCAIFDYQRFQNVSFQKFAALWRKINGKNSINDSTGGSHKELLDATGKVVIGTFSHGDAMTYTHKTIGYIREALELIRFGRD